MRAICATRFHFAGSRIILNSSKEDLNMTIFQNLDTTSPIAWSNPLRTVAASCASAAGWIAGRVAAARYARTVARLPDHLRQDIGEIDCRPQPQQPLADRLRAEPQTLETQWLRHL
jgi:hypothetical protein